MGIFFTFDEAGLVFFSVFCVEFFVCLSRTYWIGVDGGLSLAEGNGGLHAGGGILGLFISPLLSIGETGGWLGIGGRPEGVRLMGKESDIIGLMLAGEGIGLLRWLPNNCLPPALMGLWAGPFSTNKDSSWSQTARVAGDWTDKAGGGLHSFLSFPYPATDVALLGELFFALGGGGVGGLRDVVFCRWGA